MAKPFRHCTFNITVYPPDVSRETSTPVDTVTVAYHDEIVAAARAENSTLITQLRKYNAEQAETIRGFQSDLDSEKRERRQLENKLNHLTCEHMELEEKYKKLLSSNKRQLQDESALRMTNAKQRKEMRRLREERDELLDAATKPAEKKATAKTVLDKVNKAVENVEHVSFPDVEIPKKRKPNAKLTDKEVWAIRRFIKAGRTNSWIANHLNLPNIQSVYKVRTGAAYSSVPAEPERKPTTVVAGKGEVSNDK